MKRNWYFGNSIILLKNTLIPEMELYSSRAFCLSLLTKLLNSVTLGLDKASDTNGSPLTRLTNSKCVRVITGSGLSTASVTLSISSLTRDDLIKFHTDWLRPDNATIFVVGDATLDEMTPILERAFGNWRPASTPLPVKNISTVALPNQAKVIIVDKPGSPQSLILAGHVAPPSNAENNVAISAMNDVIGGQRDRTGQA